MYMSPLIHGIGTLTWLLYFSSLEYLGAWRITSELYAMCTGNQRSQDTILVDIEPFMCPGHLPFKQKSSRYRV
ncbi:hypothetical protein QBC35DRAFT_500997, partial [Podospora australis]